MNPVPVSIPEWVPPVVLVAAVLASLAIVTRLSRTNQSLGSAVRERLLLGVPWGTLLTAGGVVLVYLFLQQGLSHPRDPLVLPFVSWSLSYPIGVVSSAFSHAGLGHLRGNVLGFLAFGTVAEYALGHYPRARGSQTFSSLRTNPFARLMVIPAGAAFVGVLTGVFSFGAAIGFSGVVFAIAGFALVQMPIATVFALLARDVGGLVLRALQNPQMTAAGRTQFVTPWWANIAIHGHFFGFAVGVLAGVVLLYARENRIAPERLWFGTAVFAVTQGLWAVWVPITGNRYVLFRAYGTAAVFLLATVVTGVAIASKQRFAGVVPVETQRLATGVLLAVVVILGAAAVPFSLATVTTDYGSDEVVEVRDYRVTYGEDVPNQYVSAFDVPFINATDRYNGTGVIVSSERRAIWTEEISRGHLRRSGEGTVRLGGVGWSRTVTANRTGWSVVGNRSAYRISLKPEEGAARTVFRTGPIGARPVVAGRNISIRPANRSFELLVRNRSGGRAVAPIPATNETRRVGGLIFVREGRNVIATHEETRVRIARRESY